MDHALVHSEQHVGSTPNFWGFGGSEEWEFPNLRAEPQIGTEL